MITEGQVRVTIAILRAYARDDLEGDNALLIELEDAIEAAYDALYPEADDVIPSAYP